MTAPSAFARLRRDRAARISTRFLLVTAALAALAPLAPLDRPETPHLDRVYAPPTLSGLWRRGFVASDAEGRAGILSDARTACFGDGYLGPVLGTDELGRCVLSRLIWGLRVSLLAAVVAACVSLIVGTCVGATAGWRGGVWDAALMRLVDVFDSVPLVFVVIFIQSYLRGVRGPGAAPGSQLYVFFAVLGGVTWLLPARLVRAQALAVRERDFIAAARALGASGFRIVRTHLLPNLASTTLAAVALTLPRIVLFESFLSYLGLGVEAPAVSLGVLARSGLDAVNAVEIRPHLLLAPSVALAAVLYALNFLGDALRDAWDPRTAAP